VEEVNGGLIWSMYIIYSDENKAMKLAEIVLNEVEGEEGERCRG
jgi:hypothetical protein